MNQLWLTVESVLIEYSLVTAFALVGGIIWLSYTLSGWLAPGRLHGSAVAILIGLLLAYLGGVTTGGSKGIADIPSLAGVGLMGGTMLRDLAIVATAFGVRLDELIKAGFSGMIALFVGVLSAFAVGAAIAYAFGYHDAVSMTTIGGGAATYIVGPVTGAAIGASSEVIALSIATGLVKAVLVMVLTPIFASRIGLDSARSALIYGGVIGTTSGVAGGLAATDERLVPYGAITATFYTGLGCLVGPSVVYLVVRAIVGA